MTSGALAPGLWADLVPQNFLSKLRAAMSLEVAHIASAIDRDDVYPVQAIKNLAQRGYTSVHLAPEYGGLGASHRQSLAVFEEASFCSGAVGISLITIFQAQVIISLFGKTELQREVLPKFREGLITSYALTEANHGSDIRQVDTSAIPIGDGWRLSGRKSFITSGSAAEAFVILAQAPKGPSIFYVPANLPGLSTEATPGAATFGLRNGPHVDLVLRNTFLPEHFLIGEEGRGIRQALTTLDHSRVMAAGISLGIARAAFEGALEFARRRIAFDRAVATFQGIEWYFAEMLTAIDAARLLAYSAADELELHRGIDRHASEAKLLASRTATEVASKAIQICGAYGVRDDRPFGRFLRDAKAYEIAGGSSEILRNTIAKALHRIELGTNSDDH
jgi:alkylation response protein AidB-like acyl-CoA dehydrogenase